MDLTVDTRALADGAAWARTIAPKRPAAPVLAGIHLTADGDTLTLATFDYETCARASLDAHTDHDGQTVVSAHLLANVLATLPDTHPTRMYTDGARLHIHSGTATFALATLAVEDYPDLPAAPTPQGCLAAADLTEALAQTAASTSEDLDELSAALLHFGGDGVVITTTDRYRIAERTLAWTPTLDETPDTTVLVHHKALAGVVRGLTGDVQIGADGTLFGISDDTRSLTTRLMGTKFPRVDAILDQTFPDTAEVEVDTVALAAAAKRVATVLGPNEYLLLHLDPDAGTITVTGEDDGTDAASDTVQATITGPAHVSAYNPKFLAELLAGHGPTVRLHIPTGAVKPVMTYSGDHYRVLIMPLRRGAKAAA